MPQKYVRKHYFINPRFQTRFLISFVVPMVILIVFIGIVMFFSARTVINSTLSLIGEEIHNIIRSKEMHVTDPVICNAEIVSQLRQYASEWREGNSSGFTGSLLASTSGVLAVGLLVVLAELALLTVFVSHKIAGPMYRVQKFCESMRSGDLTSRMHLRKGDEMMEIAEDLNRVAETVAGRIREARGALEKVRPHPEDQAAFAEALKKLSDLKT